MVIKTLKNKKGSILAVSAFALCLLVFIFLELSRTYFATANILEEQNKKDAHALSVISLYIETVDKVSWINKQLKRLTALCLMAILIPELAPMLTVAEKIGMGLEKYQDLLLLRLKTYAPILDVNLRKKNNLTLVPNHHYIEYRRQPSVNVGFVRIPGLIEFNKELFESSCVKHKGVVANFGVCLDHNEYKKTIMEWFTPTNEDWSLRFLDA